MANLRTFFCETGHHRLESMRLPSRITNLGQTHCLKTGEAEIPLAQGTTRVADYASMEIRIETAGSRRALLVLAFAVAAILSVQAAIFWVASHRIESGRPEPM